MDGGSGITMYDVVVTGLFAIFIGRGIWLGFLRQITGLLALYLGYVVAGQYHDRLFPFMRDVSDNPEIVFLASYALMFVITYVVIMLFGKFLSYAVQISIVGWFDRVLGAALGGAKALIVVVLMHMALGVLLPPGNMLTKTCKTCGSLDQAADVTRQLIKSEDVRKAFKQREPAISLEAVKGYLAPISSSILGSGDSGQPSKETATQNNDTK